MEQEVMRHCEAHLGRMVEGWTKDADGAKQPFMVARFAHSPTLDMKVLCTVGLCNVPLTSGRGRLRQELVAMYRDSDGPENLPNLLQQLGNEAIAKDVAYRPGDVVPPRGPLRPGASVAGFFVEQPVYLPETFFATVSKIVFAWLIPITQSEAAFIGANGAEAFRDLLVDFDPDLIDLRRRAVV